MQLPGAVACIRHVPKVMAQTMTADRSSVNPTVGFVVR